MDKLKQRRDDRMKKAQDDKMKNNEDAGIKKDAQFEKLMRLKKNSVVFNADPVIIKFIIIYISTFILIQVKF